MTRSEAAAMVSSILDIKVYGIQQPDSASQIDVQRDLVFLMVHGNDFATRAEVISMIYNSRNL